MRLYPFLILENDIAEAKQGRIFGYSILDPPFIISSGLLASVSNSGFTYLTFDMVALRKGKKNHDLSWSVA
jgi:hypothetical protein